MSDVINLDDHRPGEDLWVVVAMCLACGSRWIGCVQVRTSLFKLECPHCGAQESFVSFLPPDYSAELL